MRSSHFSRILLVFAMGAVAFSQAGFDNNSKKANKKRDEIREMRDELLARAYEEKPSIKKEVKKAEGYAAFTNIGVNIIIASAAGGSGIVVDNKNGKEVFMKMGSGGVGFGAGVKDYRAIMVFSNRETMEKFIESGWDFSGQAEASAKAGEKGGAAETAGNAPSGVKLYQFTEAGLALQATVQATKYWVAKDWN